MGEEYVELQAMYGFGWNDNGKIVCGTPRDLEGRLGPSTSPGTSI